MLEQLRGDRRGQLLSAAGCPDQGSALSGEEALRRAAPLCRQMVPLSVQLWLSLGLVRG